MSNITLTHPTAGSGGTPLALDLPDQLSWPDEFTWQQVEQSTEYTSTGAMVIDAWAKQAGRPITLQAAANRAWCERGALVTLRAWSSQPGQVLTLLLRGAARQVVFNHGSGALDAEPVDDVVDPIDTDPYIVTLRLLELYTCQPTFHLPPASSLQAFLYWTRQPGCPFPLRAVAVAAALLAPSRPQEPMAPRLRPCKALQVACPCPPAPRWTLLSSTKKC